MTAMDSLADSQSARRFRTLFLSDLHLGTRGLQAELLLDFLKHHDAGTIYLVGDIVDGWRLKNGWYWPQAHNDVVQKLLRKARKGARVVYVPGNHDEFARDYTGMEFGGVEVAETDIHETADGKKLLVIHGDQFDIVVRHARWLAFLGDWAYEAALFTNTWANRVRRIFGVGYWSFSAWAKLKVKNAVNFIGDFEQTLAAEAARRGVDGVVCGHIHHATIRQIDGMLYVNTGDFVESCTAIAEHADGRLEIIHWQKTAKEQAAAEAAQQPQAETQARAAA
ncbi:UDP-2,3-diacylglucosamine diphosphatase [Methylosinus sp. Ce-a6]|uniref:UDP-2,3-diacylglucosamine diphosphatase n=1 Tax=Methylosinus sp. Ce-a6 TaxID=2172005 RepID=UPI00135B16B0|nr:UDP-2,3-diacylglucosamine diphosphatase [Methylosinus sp. Ce-a6]